jgi:hypothetical protein
MPWTPSGRTGEVAIPRQNGNDKPTRSSTAYEKSGLKWVDGMHQKAVVHVIADSTAVEEVKISNLGHDR